MKPNSDRILGLATALVLPIGVFSSKAIAPLAALALVGMLAVHPSVIRRLPDLPRAFPILFGATLLIAFGSIAWSHDAGVTATRALRFTAVIAALPVCWLVVREFGARELQTARKLLAIGASAGLALMLIEQVSGMSMFRAYQWLTGHGWPPAKGLTAHLSATSALASLFAWPSALAIWRLSHRVPAVLFTLVLAGTLALDEADAPLVAFALGAAALGCVIVFGRRVPKILAALMVAATLFAPFIVGSIPDPRQTDAQLPGLSKSALHRVIIWHNTVDIIRDHPVLGIGFDATRTLFGPETRQWVRFGVDENSPTGEAFSNFFEPIPLHPHNGVLQIWLETGLIGAVLFAAFVVVVLARIWQLESTEAVAVGTAMLVSGMFIFTISFGAWQAWWNCGIVLAFVAFWTATRSSETPPV